MKIVDYVDLIPDSKRKMTAEDWECVKKAVSELSAIAKERSVIFVTTKNRSDPLPNMRLQWVNPVGDDVT